MGLDSIHNARKITTSSTSVKKQTSMASVFQFNQHTEEISSKGPILCVEKNNPKVQYW